VRNLIFEPGRAGVVAIHVEWVAVSTQCRERFELSLGDMPNDLSGIANRKIF
jgi:hypothetical protein